MDGFFGRVFTLSSSPELPGEGPGDDDAFGHRSRTRPGVRLSDPPSRWPTAAQGHASYGEPPGGTEPNYH